MARLAPVPFQVLYVLLAIAYNVVSYVLVSRGELPLAPNSFLAAAIFLSIYSCIVVFGLRGYVRTYRAAMLAVVPLLAVLGVLKHFVDGYSPALYHSRASWVAAILVNVFGTAVSALGAARGPT